LPFIVGKRVFELAPPLLARAICPTVSELGELVAMAVRAVVGDAKQEPLRAHLKTADVALLGDMIAEARAQAGALDVKRWSHLADLSTSRAGFVLIGDVGLVRAALAKDQQLPGDMPPREQLRELLLFMLSDAHEAARRALGIGRGS
jgi:hypothetical protein